MKSTVLERELYPTREAAQLLRVPESTLRWWLEGRSSRGKWYPPVLREKATGSGLVTWGEFVEAGYLREYRRRDVPLGELRRFIDSLREEMGVTYPLAHSVPLSRPIAGRSSSSRTERSCLPSSPWCSK